MEDRYFSMLLSPALASLRLADGFVRNVLVLITGSTIAMIVPVLTAPLLTRLYTPEEYGVFALYVSVVSIIATPITGNYDTAIMLPSEDGEALNLVGVCLAISCIVSFALLFVSWFFSQQVTWLLGNPHISAWLYLVPLMVLLIGVHQTLSYWANRKKQFRRLAVNRIAEAVVMPLITLGAGICSFGVGGLIVGLVAGRAAATWILGQTVWRERKTSTLWFRRDIMVRQARKYSDFPVYSAPTSFLDILALQIPVLFLTKFFGSTVVGLFALATRAIGAPQVLIAGCVGQVYYQWVASARHNKGEKVRAELFRVAGWLALIVSGPLLIAVFFGPYLFSVVFGEQWRVAGEYGRVLAFPFAIKFIVSPLTTIMPASGNIKLGSIWKIIYFLSASVTLYIASRFQVKTFLYIYAVHEFILYVFYFFLVIKASGDLRMSEASEVSTQSTQATTGL